MNYNTKMFQLRENHVKRILKIIQTPTSDRSIVFFGDSITEQFDLERWLDTELPLVNSGVGGFNSETLKWIVDEAVIRHCPDQVFLMIGTNDLGDTLMNSPKDIAINIMNLVNTIQINLPACELFVISVLPCIESMHGFMSIQRGIRSNAMISVVNKAIREYLDGRATYIDAYSSFVDNQGQPMTNYFRDGLHLTSEGYECYSHCIQPYLKVKK